MDYGGKMFSAENWLPKQKKSLEKLEKPRKAVALIEDVNMIMFGFGQDADDYLKRKRKNG